MAKRILWGLVLASWVAGVSVGAPANASPGINPTNLPTKTTVTDPAQKAQLRQAYGNLPLFFIQNDGQLDSKVKFYENGRGHATYFTSDGVYLNLIKRAAETKHPDPTQTARKAAGPLSASDAGPFKSELIKLSLIKANKNPTILAETKLAGKVNYFVGNDHRNWKSDLAAFQTVRYREMYPGVDVRYYGNNSRLEYDVIVRPGADPRQIKFQYEGIKDLQVTAAGELEIILKEGSLIQKKPFMYQELDGRRVAVEGAFKLLPSGQGKHSYGFQVASYDTRRTLVIDPTLVYSTYLGGTGDDSARGIAVDSLGNVYVSGSTNSPSSFPTATPIPATNGGNADVFVAKINAAGNALVYATYFGGSGNDLAYSVAVDSLGNAYVAGSTDSTDFATASPVQASNGGGADAFVAKINAAGNALVYSTYLGGTGEDRAYGIAVDGLGNAYIAGYTGSADFPLASPIQPAYGGLYDAFVAKINAAGSSLVYSTYLGGAGDDLAYGIAVDGLGNAYVAGSTDSANFPVASPIQSVPGGLFDAFVAKINAAGSSLVYSTYLGGATDDIAYAIAVDGLGNAYITGSCYYYTTFPIVAPIRVSLGGRGSDDAFIMKLNTAGSALQYAAYFGGAGSDIAYGIAVDGLNNVYVAGSTASTNFPTSSPTQTTNSGGSDAFVAKFNPTGNFNFEYSTYLGGTGDDKAYGVAVDTIGNAYVTGSTGSNFPIASPIQAANGGGLSDAFVAKIFAGTAPSLAYSSAVAANFGAGTSPQSMAIGDFNADGKPDLATANTSSNDVSILLGDGLGSFSTSTNFSVGTAPVSVAIGDFNADGKLDLAVVNNGSNDVSVLLGDGTGSFGTATNFSVGTAPVSVAIGDFNADGKLDLAVANNGSNNVSILLGDGTGSFSTATNFSVGTGPSSVAIGDFNADGKLDLAVANNGSNDVSILLGDGTGSFSIATTFSVGTGPVSVAMADLNADGKQDLAVANYTSNNVSILLGDGIGSFGTATNFSVGTGPISVAIADLNADGKPDLVVADYNSNDVSVLLGDGIGSFVTAANVSAGTGPSSVAIRDFNADGKPDLAVADKDSNNVSVLLNTTALDIVRPSVPAGLIASAVSPTQIDLSWTASTDNVGVTGYKVYRDGSLIATLGNVLSFSDTGLASWTQHRYTVRACDAAANCSMPSTAATATTLDNVAPTVPTGLTLLSVLSNRVNLSWTASTDNVGVAVYKVYRDSVLVGTVAGLQFTDFGLTSAATHTYTVAACDAAPNCSALSGPISATTLDKVRPTIPTALMVSSVTPTHVDLSWTSSTDNVGVTGYKVYRNGMLVGAPAEANFSDTTGIIPLTRYRYTVAACDAAANCSLRSRWISVRPPPAVDLVVTALTANLSSVRVLGALTLSDTVQNIGASTMTSSSFIVGYYLSTDNVITTSDLRIGYRRVYTALASGATNSGSKTVIVPTTLPPGTYFIGAIVDLSKRQPETNEDNNALAGAQITITP